MAIHIPATKSRLSHANLAGLHQIILEVPRGMTPSSSADHCTSWHTQSQWLAYLESLRLRTSRSMAEAQQGNFLQRQRVPMDHIQVVSACICEQQNTRNDSQGEHCSQIMPQSLLITALCKDGVCGARMAAQPRDQDLIWTSTGILINSHGQPFTSCKASTRKSFHKGESAL